MTRLVVTFAVLLAATVAAQSPSGAVIVSGVVRSTDGLPLRRAIVEVTSTPLDQLTLTPAFTDADGRFALAVAAADSYTITARKAGYALDTLVVRPAGAQVQADLQLQRAAVISGKVTDSTGTPAVGRQVTARKADAAATLPVVSDPARMADMLREMAMSRFGAVTDDRGEFRLFGLPPGRYEVASPGRATGFVSVGPGAPPVPEPAVVVTLAAGQEATVDFVLDGRAVSGITRRAYSIGGSIRVVAPVAGADARAFEGTLLDEFGEPLQGARVQALFVRRQAGRFIASRFGDARGTDDRGHYRFHGLPPGRYLVMATAGGEVPGATAVGYAPVYYPGTTAIELASQVPLEDGNATGISFTVAPSPAMRVTGMALDSAGGALSLATVRLVPRYRAGSISLESLHARGPGGAFVFRDVPPGEYVVQASGERIIGRPPEFGIAYVTVGDRDPPPVVVQTSPGVTLEGRILVDGGDPLPPLAGAALPLDPDRVPVAIPERALVVSSAGTFYATGLSGRTGIVLRRMPENWFIKSIAVSGVDVTDGAYDFGTAAGTIAGAEIVLSPNGASIAGRTTGERLASARTVVVFPALRDQWTRASRRMKAAPIAADRSFHVAGLPAGRYWVAALHGLDPAIDDWQGADVLEPLLAEAVEITLGEGEAGSVQLR